MTRAVLVVENHHDLRSAMVAALTQENFECDAVLTGEAALLRLKDHNYAYILVDDDAETAAAALLERVAKHPESSPKLIVLTEVDHQDDARFLVKPFDSKELLARVNA
jgi:DNA-binding response OmpR family regulator